MPAIANDTQALAVGDVDADGDADLVLGNSLQQCRLYRNDGSGRFVDATAASLPPDSDDTASVDLGDVDGDGDLDLAVGNYLDPTRLYGNDGSGHFTDVTATSMPVDTDDTEALAFADVDGDGDLDLVLGTDRQVGITAQTRLFVNDGRGRFTDVTAAAMPVDDDKTMALALADVDGDGDRDLVLAAWAGRTRLYLNDGAGSFTDVTAGRVPNDSSTASLALGLGDVDGDGDVDVVVGNDSQQSELFLNDGSGTFANATGNLPGGSFDTQALALGDVDGDGDLDLALGNDGFRGAQDRLYLNDGRGRFTDVTASHLPALAERTQELALRDLDGDGDLDMVLANLDLQDRLYENDGSGTFVDVSNPGMPGTGYSTAALVLGDVDGDGDDDVILGNREAPNVVLFDLARHVATPQLAEIGRSYPLDLHGRTAGGTTSALLFLTTRPLVPPLALPPHGYVRVDPIGAVTLPPVVVPAPAGALTVPLRLPPLAGLNGQTILTQGLFVHSGPRGVELHLSNLVTDAVR